MIAQTRAELLKIRSTRTTIGLVLGMLAIVVLFALLSGLLTKTHNLTTKEDQLGLLGVGSFAGVFSALAGIMLVTSEYRYGTIRPTFLFSPRRSRVVAAKLAAGLLAGFGFGVVGGLLGFGIGYAALSGRGVPFALSGGEVALLRRGPLTVGGAAARSASGSARSSETRSARSSPSLPGASSSRTSSSRSCLRSDGSARSTHKTRSPDSRPNTSSPLPPAVPL